MGIQLSPISLCQYALGEYGIRGGLGTAVSISKAHLLPILSYRTQIFYTYYFCGKNYGYEIEGGLIGAEFKSTQAFPNWLEKNETNLKYHVHLLYLELGLLAKVRKNNFHQNQEWAILLGPHLLTRLLNIAHSTTPSGSGMNLASQNFLNSNLLIPNLETRVRWRKSFSRKRTFYLEPSIILPLLPSISKEDLQLQPIFLQLQLGYAFGSTG
ncbi:MAG: hypothetical protein RML72_07690 [Bacteroidia bacterium]|nr:hypothetical protein [Bacteroidia bacterium]MDW8158742.1 hypothetical protein [Bacteroidia bacterium]